MSIVKEVADKHHAKIQVDSSPNEGSCFSVIFNMGIEHFEDEVDIVKQEESPVYSVPENTENPLSTDTEAISISRIQETDNTPDKATILVVEDDPDLRHFIRTILLPFYDVFGSRKRQGRL